MKIINLHKKCNRKTRKVSQKKASGSDEPKKVLEPIDDPGEDRSLKKHPAMEKISLQRQEKKVKKTSQPKKSPKSPKFIDSSEKEEECLPQDDKGKKMPPLLGVKEEAQSFFDLQRKSKNLTFEKKIRKRWKGSFCGGAL